MSALILYLKVQSERLNGGAFHHLSPHVKLTLLART